MSIDEFLSHYEGDGFKPETLSELHNVTGGVMRNIAYFFLHLEYLINQRDQPVSYAQLEPAHIRAVYHEVF